MSNLRTPRTDAIFGEQALIEQRVGHGAEALCRELERELNEARDLHGNAVVLLNEETLKRDAFRKALESARDELKRQRDVWTGSKNDSWAVAAIDTEVRRIEAVLKS